MATGGCREVLRGAHLVRGLLRAEVRCGHPRPGVQIAVLPASAVPGSGRESVFRAAHPRGLAPRARPRSVVYILDGFPQDAVPQGHRSADVVGGST